MVDSGGIVGIKIKIMPTAPNVDLEKIENSIKEIVKSYNGRNKEYEIEPIAFGLKAIIAFFQWPEEKPIEELESKIGEIENVNSVQIIDMRKIA